MKKILSILALLTVAGAASAADLSIERREGGFGTPGLNGLENAQLWDGSTSIYHALTYLPGSPTAATIYPRVVDVECSKDAKGNFSCGGFNWRQELGRAEYLFVRPVVAKEQPVKEVVVVKEVVKVIETPCCHKKIGE
jgi:hypothetical protein